MIFEIPESCDFIDHLNGGFLIAKLSHITHSCNDLFMFELLKDHNTQNELF